MSSIFQPYIRKYNYIEEYFNAAYELYIKFYPAFPVNYYQLDTEESVIDTTGLRTGSYEKIGIGELSGYKWKKIYQLPIYGLDQITPEFDSGDSGYTAMESLRGTFNLPDIYGIKPKTNDIIDINFGLKKKNGNDIKILYVITNIATAHFGDYLNLYKCDIKVAPATKDELEKQLSKIYSFYEPTKTILPVSNAYILNKMLTRLSTLSDNLNHSFDDQRSLYFDEETI